MSVNGPLEISAVDPALVLSHIADALVLLSPDGAVMFANDAFCSMVGRSVADLEGLRWPDFADSEACARLDPIEAAAGDGQDFTIDFRGSGGERKTYCVTTSHVRDAAGRSIGILQGFRSADRLRDTILELKDVKDAVQREQDRADRAMDAIGDGRFTVDRDLVIRSFAAKMEQLTGVAAADAVGRSCRDVLRGTRCDTDCPLRRALDHEQVVERCHEQFRTPGGALAVSITTTLLHGPGGEVVGLTGVIRDDSELERLRSEVHGRDRHHHLIGRSPAMREVLAAIDTLAVTDVTVLITGEAGTGKEHVAQAIHAASARRDRPFVRVTCAILNEKLLESELFGHVRGAFPGAVADRPGRFEAAAGGTILLDQIGDTTPAFQAKLLRVLQDGTFERVGDTRSRRTDVRVIAATTRDLRTLVEEGRFREDLYSRLAVVPVHVPSLRERREDIPLLVEFFIQRYASRYLGERSDTFEGISNRALALLIGYDWPGNVRELEHAIEYALISTTANRIERAFLPAAIREKASEGPASRTSPTPPTEADALRAALEQHRWNESRTAKALGISRTTLWRRMRRLGLMEPRT